MNTITDEMRRSEIPMVKWERVKIPLLPNRVDNRSGTMAMVTTNTKQKNTLFNISMQCSILMWIMTSMFS